MPLTTKAIIFVGSYSKPYTELIGNLRQNVVLLVEHLKVVLESQRYWNSGPKAPGTVSELAEQMAQDPRWEELSTGFEKSKIVVSVSGLDMALTGSSGHGVYSEDAYLQSPVRPLIPQSNLSYRAIPDLSLRLRV